MLRPYTPALPEELEAELDLAAAGGCRGDGAGGAGDAGRILGGRRSENDQVGRVEVGAVEEVEEFGAELQGEALAELGVFEGAEIPGGEAGADVGVATKIAGEAALGRRCDKGRGTYAEPDSAGHREGDRQSRDRAASHRGACHSEYLPH